MIIGYWNKTWEPGGAPEGANMGIAFNGWIDKDNVLWHSDKVKNELVGEKFVSLGGGNENGCFDETNLAGAIEAIQSGAYAEYAGIAFDIEECQDAGLGAKFADAFAATKAKGMKVLVTVSHAAPYGCVDAKALMEGFLADSNIDYLSPQLYTSGDETRNDYQTNMDVTWEEYANARAAIVPSIVKASMYEDAVEYFKTKGVELGGYIQWAQIV
jgi:hypothetical protein